MADEITQVVEFECKGCVYLLKGSKEAIAFMGKFLMAMKDWGHQFHMNMQGQCSWKKIQEVSEGTPVVMNFPKNMFEKTMENPKHKGEFICPFEHYCKKNKLRFCKLPDLNPDDEYLPIAVPCQDAGIHSQEIEQYMKKKIEREEARSEEYSKKIQEVKDKIESSDNDEDKKKEEETLKMLEAGRTENEEMLKKSKEQMEKGNILDFNEYLMLGKGSLFDTDPENALGKYEAGGFVREYMPEDCMYPVRDEALVPDSREIYYSQMADDETILTVKRSFYQDENGIVYSNYTVSSADDDRSSKIFSDKGIDVEVWKKQLPELLKEAGMKTDVPTVAIHGIARLHSYIEALSLNFYNAGEEAGRDNKIQDEAIGTEESDREKNNRKESNSEKYISENYSSEEYSDEDRGSEEYNSEEYSSEETREYVEEIERDNEQRSAYERSQYTTIVVPATSVMADGSMELSLELEEGLVNGIELVSMEHNEAVIRIKDDEDYQYELKDGKICAISGVDIINKCSGEASENITKAASKSASRR